MDLLGKYLQQDILSQSQTHRKVRVLHMSFFMSSSTKSFPDAFIAIIGACVRACVRVYTKIYIFCVYTVIANDVSDYMNLLLRIAHIICNHSLCLHNHHRLSRIRTVGLFRFRTYFLKLMNLLDSWKDSLDGRSTRRKASAYTGQHKHSKMRTHIHASGGIRTHDPSVRAAENSKCF